MGKITDRIIHALNLFSREPDLRRTPPSIHGSSHMGMSQPSRPYANRAGVANERSMIESIYSKIANDASDIEFRHVDVDEEGRYLATRDSGLQYCFSKSPNLDQAPRAFRRDLVMTALHTGHAAVVPVATSGSDPLISDAYDVLTMRVGIVEEWYPHHVKVRVYNDNVDKGIFESLTLPKRIVAIIENPFYSVMNEQNSTLQRIVRKLNLLDVIDDNSANSKLDIFIQLPHTLRTQARREEAENRRQEIEFQLTSGKYGIAYLDASEHVTQLNRPVENNLWPQIDALMKLLFSQLGTTEEIMNGSANESVMSNYMARTIEPILDSIAQEFERKFLSRTAISQKQAVRYYRNLFKLIPVTEMADLIDVLSRNEIATPNEIRREIGFLPVKDSKADILNNRNMPDTSTPKASVESSTPLALPSPNDGESELDSRMKELGL